MQPQRHIRPSRPGIGHAILTLVIVGALIASCAEVASAPQAPDLAAIEVPDGQWVGCAGERRFTGTGRLDPVDIGKVSFGFNVDGGAVCGGKGPVRGQLQLIYHATQTLVHSVTMVHFASFTDPVHGSCGEFDGTARVKHRSVGGDWHDHHYFAVVCDNGEPGRGVDRVTFTLDGVSPLHQNLWAVALTGGNIQAH